jgi:hypothetical protein
MPGLHELLRGGGLDLVREALAIESQQQGVSLVRRTAQRVPRHDDAEAAVDSAKHGGENAHVRLGSGHDEAVDLALPKQSGKPVVRKG